MFSYLHRWPDPWIWIFPKRSSTKNEISTKIASPLFDFYAWQYSWYWALWYSPGLSGESEITINSSLWELWIFCCENCRFIAMSTWFGWISNAVGSLKVRKFALALLAEFEHRICLLTSEDRAVPPIFPGKKIALYIRLSFILWSEYKLHYINTEWGRGTVVGLNLSPVAIDSFVLMNFTATWHWGRSGLGKINNAFHCHTLWQAKRHYSKPPPQLGDSPNVAMGDKGPETPNIIRNQKYDGKMTSWPETSIIFFFLQFRKDVRGKR